MIAELAFHLYVSAAGVDANPGTADRPVRSIARAAELAKPGTVVHVAPGTYEGGFQTAASGTAEAPIVYLSEVPGAARIVPPADSRKQEAWDNRGADVVIDGFEIDGSAYRGGKPWLFGVYTTGSRSVVRNTKVHDIARDAAAMRAANTGNQGGAGIMGDSYYGGLDITISGNTVYNIGPAEVSSNLVHGVYMATRGTVLNNLIYQVVGDGISTWHDATEVKILNNTVFQARGAGILVGAGDFYKRNGPHDGSRIANNLVYDNTKGIEEGGAVGTRNAYTHNLVYGNRTDWRLRVGRAEATVAADPRFVRYDRLGGGDYRLAPGSPAIDAGTPAAAPAIDLDGVARPQNRGVDIGAYERAGPTKTSAAVP